MHLLYKNVLLLFIVIFLVSCGGGGDTSGGSSNSNDAPIITNTSMNVSVQENKGISNSFAILTAFSTAKVLVI